MDSKVLTPLAQVHEEFRNRGPIRYWIKVKDAYVAGPFYSRDIAQSAADIKNAKEANK